MTADRILAPLSADDVRDRLGDAAALWRRIQVVDETRSTNADVVAAAAAGTDIVGSVLFAEHQSAGRGRNGRTWSGVPRTQILMSVGVSLESVPTEAWGWLPLLTGIAVVDAVGEVTGVRAGLKWPNDVLVDGRKLAGILAELAAPRPAVVVGLGLNVAQRADELPDSVAATSLAVLCPSAPERAELAAALLRRLADLLSVWRRGDPQLANDYRERSSTIGTQVRAVLPGDQQIVGIARGIDEQGRLIIDTDDGSRTVSAGDIVHLRPAGGSGPQ